MPARRPTEIHELLTEGFLADDIELLVSLYEDDAVWLPGPGDEPIRGIAEIREAFERLTAFKIIEGEVVPTLCMERDDQALTSCKWHFKAKAPDGQIVEFRGRGTELMRRQPDGTWLHLIDNPWNDVEFLQPDGSWMEVTQSPWSKVALKQAKSA